jgi:predicted aconitase
MASFGSVAMFHIPGLTPEALSFADASGGRDMPSTRIDEAAFQQFYARYAAKGHKVDVVVFGAPQLSLLEIESLAGLLDGRRVHPATTLIVTTSPEIKFAADRMGLTRRIEESGAVVAAGICFYQSYAREMAEANGWQRLLTNSAKLVNIIAGYGYRPTLASTEACVDSAIKGQIV